MSITEMAIKELDSNLLVKQFKELSNAGVSEAEVMLQFMEYAIPMFEKAKRQIFVKILESVKNDLINQMWDDPRDQNIYSQIYEISNIAKTLKVNSNASKN